MIYRISKKLVDTMTWAASSTVQMDLPTDGLITRIDFRANITPSATLATANQPDSLPRVVNTFKIEGGGGRSYFGLSCTEQSGRLWHLLNKHDFPGVVFHDPLSTANNIIFRFHAGSRPRDMYGRDNPFDLSAFIPGQRESNLKATWATTANTVLDDTVTISSGTMYAYVWEVLGYDLVELPGGRWVARDPDTGQTIPARIPISSTESYAHTANKSDLSQQFDVPTGANLRRVVVLVQDDTATRPLRADDEVTEIGILYPRENRRIVEAKWVDLVYGQGLAYDMITADVITCGGVPSGFAVVDLRPYGDADYGLNLSRASTGDVKLAATIENYASGDDSFYWYDQVQDYMG